MALVEFVNQEEAKRRYEICVGNKEYYPCEKYFSLTGSCKKCGCFVRAKTKVFKRGKHIEKCPLNKW